MDEAAVAALALGVLKKKNKIIPIQTMFSFLKEIKCLTFKINFGGRTFVRVHGQQNASAPPAAISTTRATKIITNFDIVFAGLDSSFRFLAFSSA